MAQQLHFSGFERLQRKEFGGSLIKGNPREQRPIAVKRPMHVVVRSSHAKGERSFLRPKNAKRIRELIVRLGKQKGVKVYGQANSGNHLHLIVLPRSREAFKSFIRAATGVIARVVLGAEKGSARRLQFWDARPFTRILEWGRDYQRARRYLEQNTLEALGFIPYQLRGRTRAKSPDRP